VDELEYQGAPGHDAHAARKERAADYALQDRALPGTLDVKTKKKTQVTSNVIFTTVNVTSTIDYTCDDEEKSTVELGRHLGSSRS
jgi:hypothetical protein